MSGIVTLFHLDGRPVLMESLQRLADPMFHRGVDGQTFWTGGRVGMVFQHLRVTPQSSGEVQPLGCPADHAICFDGRLDNREELLATLPLELLPFPPNAPDAALVMAVYRRFGDSFAEQLNGDFAVVLYDGGAHKLLLARDVMGIRPLYYCVAAETVIAASEIKAILAYPEMRPRPDDEGLADMVLRGGVHRHNERTCFRDVARVVPGQTVVITPGKKHLFRHWDFDPGKQVRFASVGEYAEGLHATFEQAVRRRLRSAGPVAVLVSGGLDSSGIFCKASGLKRAGAGVAPAVGISMLFPQGADNDEKQFLDCVESACETEIRKLPFSRFSLLCDQKLLWHSEAPHLLWDAADECLKAARDSRSRVVLDGYYGDQMLGSDAYLADLARGFHWLQLKRECDELVHWMAELSQGVLRRELGGSLLRSLIPEWARLGLYWSRRLTKSFPCPPYYRVPFRQAALIRSRPQGDGIRFPNNHAKVCYQRASAGYRLNLVEQENKICARYGLEKAYPYMDRDLVQFIMSIPGDALNWGGVYKGLFREAMRAILPEPIRQRNWKADFTAMHNAAGAADFPRLWGYLLQDSLAVMTGYVDREILEREFSRDKADSVSKSPAPHLLAVVGLEVWLRTFFVPADFASGGPVT
ncbi:MAG: asparagine synthetase B [Terriglobales bacterium]